MNYAYNYAGELTSITYPSGRVITQSLDNIGRLSSVSDTTTTYASGYGYNAANQPTGFKYGNNIYASIGYSNDRLQLSCIDYSSTNRGGTCVHDGTTKFGVTPTYPAAGSNNGLITGITDSVDAGRTAAYTYDSLYRLATAVTTGSTNYPKWGLSWVYDRYGNRTDQNQTYSNPPMNHVTIDSSKNRINTSGYAYDANGNMTNDGFNTLVYDAENRTLSATNGSTSGTYSYDGNNLRVKKVSGSTTTVYLFSGAKVIAEYVNGVAPTAPTREYIYSGATLLAKIEAGATKYYHQDLLSNRMVTDSSGTVVAQIGHYPYGESWYNATNDKLLFTSYERDAESGNDYAMARYYVSRLGRFSAVDPLSGSTGDPQSLNRYAYVMDNPLSYVDPTGLCGDIITDPVGGQDCSNQFPGSGSAGWTIGGGYGRGLPPGCSWISWDQGTYSCAPNLPMPGQCLEIVLDGFDTGQNTCDPNGSGNRGGGTTSGGKSSGPTMSAVKKPPCVMENELDGSLDAKFLVGLQTQLATPMGMLDVGGSLYKSFVTGQTGGQMSAQAGGGVALDRPTPPGGSINGGAEPANVIWNLGPYQYNQTTGESGVMKDKNFKLGGAFGIGIEIDFNLTAFWQIHKQNDVCRQMLANWKP